MNIRYKILLLFVFLTNVTFAQIAVEAVELIETVDNHYVSKIPKVVDASKENRLAVGKINTFLLNRFMIKSYNQNEIEEFRWYEVDFNCEIKEDILFIKFTGEYYGAYPNYIEEELFFDLKTGDELFNADIPFQSIFSLHGYLNFMNEYWLEEVKPAFVEAVDCADYQPYCSFYDIDNYTINEKEITIALTNDCYARVNRACSPYVSMTLPLDSIKVFLSNVGNEIIFADDYPSKKGIDKYLYNQSIAETLPKNTYLFGKIDNAYAFSMALDFKNDSDEITGYYYYDSKLEEIKLIGHRKDITTILLTESVNNNKTGSFILNLSSAYNSNAFAIREPHEESKYLTGNWSNADKTKTYAIEFSEVKTNGLF